MLAYSLYDGKKNNDISIIHMNTTLVRQPPSGWVQRHYRFLDFVAVKPLFLEQFMMQWYLINLSCFRGNLRWSCDDPTHTTYTMIIMNRCWGLFTRNRGMGPPHLHKFQSQRHSHKHFNCSTENEPLNPKIWALHWKQATRRAYMP